jgi:GMP synthase-like glutamine amidotransferase
LLDHVRCFMRDRVQVWSTTERDVLARGVCLGAHALAGVLGSSADVSAYVANVVSGPEALLDGIQIRQGIAAFTETVCCSAMYRCRIP